MTKFSLYFWLHYFYKTVLGSFTLILLRRIFLDSCFHQLICYFENSQFASDDCLKRDSNLSTTSSPAEPFQIDRFYFSWRVKQLIMEKKTTGIFSCKLVIPSTVGLNKCLTKQFTVSYIYFPWIIFYIDMRTEQKWYNMFSVVLTSALPLFFNWLPMFKLKCVSIFRLSPIKEKVRPRRTNDAKTLKIFGTFHKRISFFSRTSIFKALFS